MLRPTDDDLLVDLLDRLLEFYEMRADAEDRGDWAELQAVKSRSRPQKPKEMPCAAGPSLVQRKAVGMAKQRDPAARRHRREKAVIEWTSRDVKPEAEPADAGTRSPVTETGLPVEDQVRKDWDPRKGGLPTF